MTQPVQEPSQGRQNQSQDWRTRQLFRRPAPPLTPQYAIKLFSDTQVTVVGDDRFRFTVPHTMGGWYLSYVELGLGYPDSGTTSAQLQNVDNANTDMLSTVVQIDAGEHTSQTAGTPFVIQTAGDADQVAAGDRIAVDVDAGSDGMGLHIYVWFAGNRP